MAKDPRTSYQWKKRIRPQVLARDDFRCQIRGPKCTTHATVVDHVIPLSLGGDPYDSTNLRAACVACNSGRRFGQPQRSTQPRGRPAIAFAPFDDHYPGPSRVW
jgi:5-methylcytosine-specific restriction endonuclease McrA